MPEKMRNYIPCFIRPGTVSSIGISIYPMDGNEYEELLDKSDKALYEVKKNGKNGFCFYHEDREE